MLETLLKHFRSYGMEDLEFIIVNSKISHSQEKLPELTRRVSFDVYQETDEEEVWSVMEGGKDDMYVYDRCGRLTYYIPFPLSILNESPLVSNAILATYFRSPCGLKCDANATLDIEDIVNNMENNFENANETNQDNSTNSGTEQSVYATESFFEKNETSNDTIRNDVLKFIDSINSGTDDLSSNNTKNILDYDYLSNTNNSLTIETNNSRVDEANTFFNRIYKLFFNYGNQNDTVTENTPSSNSESSTDGSNQLMPNLNVTSKEASGHAFGNHHHPHRGHHKHNQTDRDTNKEKKKSDRCLEADYEVCKSWSKNRLLHAQKCCSEKVQSDSEKNQKSCAHFGKKRCKKIQSILKCCIKTVYTELTSETGPVGSTTVEPIRETTEFADVVCCKPTENGKLCRVSGSEMCEEGEELQQSSSSLP